MELFKRILSIFLLALFVAYSGGVGFSVHRCAHCQQKKVYLLYHPDCCCEAARTGQQQADNCKNGNCCCSHQEEKTSDEEKEASTPYHHSCCITEYQFYKIQENYFAPKQEKWLRSTDFLLFKETVSLHWEQYIVEKIKFSNNHPNPPPLLPGGEDFIVFIHQLLFYA